MKVCQFEKKYNVIQDRAKELEVRIKPLLKELRKLGRSASSLCVKADFDDQLYKKDKKGGSIEDGWNISILHRLAFLDCTNEVDGIFDALHNVIHTPFYKKGKKQCQVQQ